MGCNCQQAEPTREQREAAERRQQAAREGRDVRPATKPDTGRVER